MYFYIERETGSEDILPQDAVFSRLFQSFQRMRACQRIFLAYINKALRSADGIRADDQSFQDAVWIAFQDAAVHVRAGIAFICVHNDIFGFIVSVAGSFPFPACGKSAAAASAQVGLRHFVEHGFRRHL